MKKYYSGLPKEVFWDMSLAESVNGVKLKMHEPIRKGTVLTCDKPWEGAYCGYGKIVFDGEKYRLYYRGRGSSDGAQRTDIGDHGVWCVAYSYDGKTFTRPDLGIFDFGGDSHNNIVMQLPNYNIDNFSITFDENPNCHPDERYKAFLGDDTQVVRTLHYYVSRDGTHFEEREAIKAAGRFDSLNVCFWDEKTQRYCLYLRGLHNADPERKIPYEIENHVRDVRVSYSTDMEEWTEPVRLEYGENDTDEIQLYTNNIGRYEGTDIFLGIPTRYIDRSKDAQNYNHLPDILGFRPMLTEKYGRVGTAMTEAMLMTSRDGLHFERTNEAFFTPGIENRENWVYGDGYFIYGWIETSSDFEGEPNELSLYVGKGYIARPVNFERYTLRMDGFFSWRADYEGGEAITKPFTFEGSELRLNFSTSALGYLRVEILDEDGNAIEGYDSGRLFGNSTDRPCDFERPLSDLAGKPIRFKLSMRDADLYAFKFI